MSRGHFFDDCVDLQVKIGSEDWIGKEFSQVIGFVKEFAISTSVYNIDETYEVIVGY